MASERGYDKTVADSFPASDPPANSGITGAEPPKRGTGEKAGRKPSSHQKPSSERDTAERPTGTPTSDRHATETAHAWADER